MGILIAGSLSGGVAIGTSCDLVMRPEFALVIGGLTGIVAAFGIIKYNQTY
jgi:ammonia channel protein AmtB